MRLFPNCPKYPVLDQVGILTKYLILYHKYCSTYGYEKLPNVTVVPMRYSHIHCFNPINLYLSIRYNRIINKI